MKYFRYTVLILLLLLTVFNLLEEYLDAKFRFSLGGWLVLFVTAVVLFYKSRVYIALLLLAFFIELFGAVRGLSEAIDSPSTWTEIEDSPYSLEATPGSYEVVRENFFYTKKIAYKESSLFYAENSKTGLYPAFLFRIRVIKEDEKQMVLKIETDKTLKIDTLAKYYNAFP